MLTHLNPWIRTSLNNVDFWTTLGLGTETYCRFLWSPHHHRPHQRTGVCADREIVDIHEFVESADFRDCYYQSSQCFNWRNVGNVSALNAFYIDIDVRHYCSDEHAHDIAHKIHQHLSQQGVTPFNYYVTTGSGGLHLYWLFTPVPAYKRHQSAYLQAVSHLLDMMPDLDDPYHVDQAVSRDLVRYLRLPGTLNTKTLRKAQAYSVSDGLYSFEALLDNFGINARAHSRQHTRDSEGIALLETLNELALTENDIPSPYAQSLTHLLNYARTVQTVPKGKRNNFLFITYCLLLKLKPNSAYEIIVGINERFVGLRKSLMDTYLRTATRKRYRFGYQKLKDRISEFIASDFLNRTQFKRTKAPPIPLEERTRRQAKAALHTAKIKAQRTLQILKDTFHTLHQTRLSVTQENVSLYSAFSLRTVQRYWSQLITKHVIS